MGLNSKLFLAIVLLPSLLAITVKFNNGESALYTLEEVKDNTPLQGGQGFVLFAIVDSSPPGFEFQKGAEVALKFGFTECEDEMHREQEAHDFIRAKDPKGEINVVKAEKFLGRLSDFKEIKHLVLKKVIKGELHILIMERLSMNLIDMYIDQDGISHSQQEVIYDQFCLIMKKLRDIDLVHGDIKPDNILFIANDLYGGIKLADLGLSRIEGKGMNEVGGDPFYISPVQLLLQRPATHNDCEVSGALTFTYVALLNPLWITILQDAQLDAKRQQYDLHTHRATVAKYRFVTKPSSTFRKRIPKSFEKKITETLQFPEVGKINGKIDKLVEQIEASRKKDPRRATPYEFCLDNELESDGWTVQFYFKPNTLFIECHGMEPSEMQKKLESLLALVAGKKTNFYFVDSIGAQRSIFLSNPHIRQHPLTKVPLLECDYTQSA